MTMTMTMTDKGYEGLSGIQCEYMFQAKRLSPGQNNSRRTTPCELMITDEPLSFWGGVDPLTGQVIDTKHAWHGQSVADKIICLPSGRGSCTTSQVLLELILNAKAPKAIVLRDVDGLMTIGALVADEVFDRENDHLCIPDMLWTGPEEKGHFRVLQQAAAIDSINNDTQSPSNMKLSGYVAHDGQLIVGTKEVVQAYLDHLPLDDNNRSENEPERSEIVFSAQEQRMLNSCQERAETMALHIIFRFAEVMKLSERHHQSSSSSCTIASPNTNTSATIYRSIASAHIDGCTYIGRGGLEFARRLVEAGGRVKVPTTLNAVSADRLQWQKLGVPEDYARNSITLGDYYLQLQCQPTFTCAPYLLPASTATTTTTGTTTTTVPPQLGQHICWGESSAVVYANSVLGARTAKYADYLDICCAIAGIIPETDVHLDQNRIPSIVLDAREFVQQISATQLYSSDGGGDCYYSAMDSSWDALFPVLGHLCGSLSDGKVPILIGLETWAGDISSDHLKAFCAAFGTTGTSPLIHIVGITPEACDPIIRQQWSNSEQFNNAWGDDQVVPITLDRVRVTFDKLDRDQDSNPPVELIALGNPHLSLTECQQIVQRIHRLNRQHGSNGMKTFLPQSLAMYRQERFSSSQGATTTPPTTATTLTVKKNSNLRIMACISREVYRQAQEKGYIAQLQEFGVEFVHDTCWCMLLDPPVIPRTPGTATLTNSGKYAHYGPGLTNRLFRFASTADCIETAVTGVFPSRRPTWLLLQSKSTAARSFSTNTIWTRSFATSTTPTTTTAAASWRGITSLHSSESLSCRGLSPPAVSLCTSPSRCLTGWSMGRVHRRPYSSVRCRSLMSTNSRLVLLWMRKVVK